MSRHSLRLRLAVAQTASIVVVLVLAGIGLVDLFERHLERRVGEELATYVRQLTGQLRFVENATPSLAAPLTEPRFDVPLSGLYWQITVEPSGLSLRSRSLWDQVLALPADAPAPGERHRHVVKGPGGGSLLVHERLILVETPAGEERVRIAAALDRRTLDRALDQYRTQLAIALVGLGLVLALAAWAQLWFGLRPVEAVRRAVLAVREGRNQRLEGRFPDEFQPLAAEVDALLDAQQSLIEGARTRAADLAHGLKTPLTVLQAEARKLAASGDAATAEVLDGLARDMRRQVERELARSRMAGARARPAATLVAPLVQRLIDTLVRTPKGERLDWEIDIPPSATLAVDAGDMAELLGNLLDNAAKWARSTVTVASAPAPGSLALTIADDGPGVPAGDRERLGERFVRLDTDQPGHGIGLAIARDIVDAYGGHIAFGEAIGGGLEVRLSLPAKPATPDALSPASPP